MVSVLGITDDVKRELPDISVDPLSFTPIPKLEPAGQALLQTWCTLQLVDVNFASLIFHDYLLTRDLIGEPFSVPPSYGTVRGNTVVHL